MFSYHQYWWFYMEMTVGTFVPKCPRHVRKKLRWGQSAQTFYRPFLLIWGFLKTEPTEFAISFILRAEHDLNHFRQCFVKILRVWESQSWKLLFWRIQWTQWMSDKSNADLKHTNAKGSVSKRFLDVLYENTFFLWQYTKSYEYRILISCL